MCRSYYATQIMVEGLLAFPMPICSFMYAFVHTSTFRVDCTWGVQPSCNLFHHFKFKLVICSLSEDIHMVWTLWANYFLYFFSLVNLAILQPYLVYNQVRRLSLNIHSILLNYLNQCMRFPTMWYVRPTKPQISLRICSV